MTRLSVSFGAMVLLTLLSVSAKAASAVEQTLAVSVPENRGIVLRLYRIASDGTTNLFSRTRLADTNEASNLQSLSFSPNGRFAYGSFFRNGSGKQQIRQYRFGADGSLTPLSASSVAVGDDVPGVSFSPSGRSAYVIDRAAIWQWRCRRTGELTPLPTPHIAMGQAVQHHDLRREITKPGDKFSTFEIENNDTVSPLAILFASSGRYAYVFGHEYYYKGREIVTSLGSHGGGTEIDVARFVVRFRVNPDGELVSPTPRMPLPVTTSSVVLSPTALVLYAADNQSKTITPYSVAGDAVLPLNPSSSIAGESICLDPHGHYAYAATAGAITQYRIRDDGSLEPLVPAFVSVPTPGINGPNNPQFAPGQLRASLDGKFLFARYTNWNTVVAAYAIGSGGTLSPKPTSIVPVSGYYGFGEMSVLPALPQRAPLAAVDGSPLVRLPPTRREQGPQTAKEFAYVLNSHEGTISQFRVSDEGTLLPLTPPTVAAGWLPGMDLPSMAVDPSGNFLYVPTSLGESVSQFRITPMGTLTPLSSPAVKFASGVNPTEIAIDPAGGFAFVAGQNDMKIHAFSIGQDGMLTAKSTDDLPFSPGFGAIFVNPAVRMLLIRHDNNYVDSYRFGTDGHLGYLARFQPNLGQSFTFDPTGRFAFYGDGDGQVWQFVFGADGSLKENVPRAVPADEQPEAVAITPDGRFAYAANTGDFRGDGSISCYRLDQNGRLSILKPDPILTDTSPTRVTIDPSGRFLYALDTHNLPADAYAPGVISQYRIMPDGSLTPLSPMRVMSGIGGSAMIVVRRL